MIPTVPATARIDRSPESRFRHDLLTPVNHILGYASLLLDAAQDRGQSELWPPLHDLGELGRRVLAVIEDALPSAPEPDHRPDHRALADRLAGPTDAILARCDELETAGVDNDAERSEFLSDVAGIRDAARRLVELARSGPPA